MFVSTFLVKALRFFDRLYENSKKSTLTAFFLFSPNLVKGKQARSSRHLNFLMLACSSQEPQEKKDGFLGVKSGSSGEGGAVFLLKHTDQFLKLSI